MKDEQQEIAGLDASSPARYGAYVAMVAGAAIFGFGVYLLFATSQPVTLASAIVVAGFLESFLGWSSLRRARAAWAFSCSLNGTLLIVLLFGAPKVRDIAEISIGFALLPSFVFGLLLMLYVLGRDDF